MQPRADLARQLSQARTRTDELFRIVRPDSFYERPIPERHRIIFYLGHLEAFDWNLLGTGALELAPFHPTFDRLFAFGIDPLQGKLPAEPSSEWPSVDEVRGYNARVRALLDEGLTRMPQQLLHVAIEHRLMHYETFAYMLHNLNYERKAHVPAEIVAAPNGRDRSAPEMVEVPEGDVRLGKNASDGFGWDNEFCAHTVSVPAFAAMRRKVTNGEYMRFVEQGAPAPHFWSCRNGHWSYRGMFREIPLPLNWPVYVTHAEAQRYRAWVGKQLMTEAQYHRLACVEDFQPGRHRIGWDPIPVDASGENALGISQIADNGWEWTATVFQPFPGFQPFPFYPGYSADFFDDQHYVMKGASPATLPPLVRPTFRNWFRPSYPYMYATFRLVENR